MAVEDSSQTLPRGLDEPDAARLLAEAAGAAARAPTHLSAMIADLFLPEAGRLKDIERVTLAQLLAKLVRAVEDDLRQRLIAALGGEADEAVTAALGAAAIDIAGPVLERSGVLRDPDFFLALRRRAEEHRLSRALRAASASEEEAAPSLLDEWLLGGDSPLAEAAMAYLVADSRRFDRFQDPVLARTDLSAELQHRLIWWVAAALRDYLTGVHRLTEVQADRALAFAATQALAGYDEGETLEGRALLLARRLHAALRIDDALLVRAVQEGRLVLAVAAMAVRAGIGFPAAWDMLAAPGGSRLLILLAAIGMAPADASRIALALALAAGEDGMDLPERMNAFALLDPDRARAAILPWRLDEGYRRAIAELAAAEQDRPGE